MIKRYWWSFIVIVLVLAGIGTFYMQAAAESRPQVRLEHVSGDPQAGDGLVLSGSYSKDGFDSPVTVDTTGAHFDNGPLFTRIFSSSQGAEWKELKDRYPSFIRGKSEEQGLYEDEQFLAYGAIAANSDYTSFKIAVLDKKTGKTVSKRIPVPHATQYRSVYTTDTQLADNQMKVVTSNFLPQGSIEYHLYTFDWKKGEVTGDQVLFNSEKEKELLQTQTKNDGQPLSVGSSLLTSRGTKPGRYALLETVVQRNLPSTNERASSDTNIRLTVFDLADNRQDTALSEALSKLVGGNEDLRSFEMNGNTANLLLAKEGNTAVRLVQYHLDSKQAREQTISFADKKLISVSLTEGRLYLMTAPSKDTTSPVNVLVYDAGTGSPVYEGKVSWDTAQGENGTASRLSADWSFYYLDHK